MEGGDQSEEEWVDTGCGSEGEGIGLQISLLIYLWIPSGILCYDFEGNNILIKLIIYPMHLIAGSVASKLFPV